jgi:hypothetical protein
MSLLDTFYILFDSDASKLDKGLEESEKKAEKLTDKLKDVDKHGAKAGASLYGLIEKGAGLLGVGLSIGALVAGVKSTAAAYDELGKLAARFRSTTEAIDEFTDASTLLGISEEASVGALKSLETAIQDTFLGMGRAKKVFEEIGISVTDAAGKVKPTTVVMAELAEKLHGMERGTQIRVMERLGLDPAMLKLFNADFVALQKRMNEVDRASGFNLEQAVKRAAEYTKASKGLSVEVNTLKMYMEKLAESFKVSTMPFFTDALTTATKYVKQFVDFLLKHNKFVEGVFIAIGAAITYFMIPAAIKGAVAVWAMIAPFLLIGLAVAAVGAAFALLYEDVMTFLDGGESLIGQLVEWVKSFEFLNALVGVVAAGFRFLWAAFGQGLDIVAEFISQSAPLQSAFGILKTMIDGVGEALSFVWNLIKQIGSGIGSALGAVGSAFGKGLDITTKGLIEGKSALDQAAKNPLASLTSNSISNTSKATSRSTSVNVGKVEVKTAATDAEGISKAIGGSMRAQMQQAAANFDDGVLA